MKKKIKLKLKHGVIKCSCPEGDINIDTTGKIAVHWSGKCNGCDRLEKCIDAIRCFRNTIYDQNQK